MILRRMVNSRADRLKMVEQCPGWFCNVDILGASVIEGADQAISSSAGMTVGKG